MPAVRIIGRRWRLGKDGHATLHQFVEQARRHRPRRRDDDERGISGQQVVERLGRVDRELRPDASLAGRRCAAQQAADLERFWECGRDP